MSERSNDAYAFNIGLLLGSLLCLALSQIHWPDRYVQLFGEAMYDINQHRSDDVPFEEQLRGLENVIKAGKVRCRCILHPEV